jgi:hypothetical protein
MQIGSPSTPVTPKTTMLPHSATRKRKLVSPSPLAVKHPKILSPVPNTPPATPQSPQFPVLIRRWHFAPNTGSPHATYVAQSPNTPIAMQWEGDKIWEHYKFEFILVLLEWKLASPFLIPNCKSSFNLCIDFPMRYCYLNYSIADKIHDID